MNPGNKSITAFEDKVLALPFDQYQRYKLLQEIINVIREGNRSFSVIDIGGYPGCLLDFLPNDKVTITDQVECDLPEYRKVDALNLPFEDKSFDIVVSTEVIENL